MVRIGDRSAAVPAYNGSLFASAGFPGSDLLERAEVADIFPSSLPLMAIAYETDKSDCPRPGLRRAPDRAFGSHLRGCCLTLRLARSSRKPGLRLLEQDVLPARPARGSSRK